MIFATMTVLYGVEETRYIVVAAARPLSNHCSCHSRACVDCSAVTPNVHLMKHLRRRATVGSAS